MVWEKVQESPSLLLRLTEQEGESVFFFGLSGALFPFYLNQKENAFFSSAHWAFELFFFSCSEWCPFFSFFGEGFRLNSTNQKEDVFFPLATGHLSSGFGRETTVSDVGSFPKPLQKSSHPGLQKNAFQLTRVLIPPTADSYRGTEPGEGRSSRGGLERLSKWNR